MSPRSRKRGNQMKCDFCPFAPPSGPEGADDCPMFDEYGTEWKDGRCGCTLSYSHLKKLDEMRSEYYGIMGMEMGLEMDFENHGLSMEKAVDHAKHMIGLDGFRHKPYTRHRKQFYRPYRNHWAGFDAELDYMSHKAFGLTEKQEPDRPDGMPFYYLTRAGLDWLGRQIGVTIRDPED